jgi:TonB family protein
LYSAAAYEDALDLLKKLNVDSPASRPTEAAVYEMLCLVALGRQGEAKNVMSAIVRADPFYHLTESAAPPRLRALFEDVRRPLLSDIVRQAYAKGREAFERKDLPAAAAAFGRVMTLLDDPDIATLAGSGDLRTLAAGFRDLSRIGTPPATPAPPPVAPQVFGPRDADVTPPEPIIQRMPAWNPAKTGDGAQQLEGAVELVLDETGRVSSVSLIKSVHPDYDGPLLAAAKKWKFLPAMVHGAAVRYRLMMTIVLRRIG